MTDELGKLIDGHLTHAEFQKELSKYLAVSPKTVDNWVGDRFRALTNKRDLLIYKLHLLGWMQQEIADQVVNARYEKKYTQQSVNKVLQQFAKLQKVVISQFEQGKPVPDIVRENGKYYGIDETLAWAILLRNKTDKERIELLSEKMKDFTCEIRPYDVWPSSTLLIQLLFFYTKQSNFVIDPTAMSEPTIGVCLLMNRKCGSYDITPPEERRNTLQTDAIETVKNLKKKVDLFFLKLPCFEEEEKQSEESRPSLTREKYLEHFKELADICKEKLAPSGKVAILVADHIGNDPCNSIFIDRYITLFRGAGFVVDRIIQCPQSIDQIHPDVINESINSRKLCNIARYLVIFREVKSA